MIDHLILFFSVLSTQRALPFTDYVYFLPVGKYEDSFIVLSSEWENWLHNNFVILSGFSLSLYLEMPSSGPEVFIKEGGNNGHCTRQLVVRPFGWSSTFCPFLLTPTFLIRCLYHTKAHSVLYSLIVNAANGMFSWLRYWCWHIRVIHPLGPKVTVPCG